MHKIFCDWCNKEIGCEFHLKVEIEHPIPALGSIVPETMHFHEDCGVRLRNLFFQSADVAKWIISSDGYYPYCSHCKTEPKNGMMSNYCPECGARMDGEK